MYSSDPTTELFHAGTVLCTDRRADQRRRSAATAWLMDEDLEQAIEFARVSSISRGGLSLDISPGALGSLNDPAVGHEWLLMVDDPTSREPLACQRPVVAIARRIESLDNGDLRIGCTFPTRRVGQCVSTQRSRQRCTGLTMNLADDLSDGLLDELTNLIEREIHADESFGPA